MPPPRAAKQTQPQPHWPYLRVYFRCANAYTRVYRRPDEGSYLARCPRCGLCKRFQVGTGGTDQRFFELTCRP